MQIHSNTFEKLIKNLRNTRPGVTVLNCAILAEFASQHLVKALRGAAKEHSIELVCLECDYDSIETTVLDQSSPLYSKVFDFIIIFQSPFKLYRHFSSSNSQQIFAAEKLGFIENTISLLQERTKSKIILSNYAEFDDRVFGNYANKTPHSFIYQIRKLNFELMNLSISKRNLFILDVQSLFILKGRANSFDPKLFIHADLVYNLDFLGLMAEQTLQIIAAMQGSFKKCIILDLDNTLWGGTIGDDGIEKIEIGDLGVGKAFGNFQVWLRNLKNRGIILAVSSKNTEAIAKEVFATHPAMILRLEDIAVFSANWETKVDNILFIQSILKIGFDSIVFLDDSPFERSMVKESIPGITVPDLPEDPAEYLEYLQSLNLFETASLSEEDTLRTTKYQEEASRSVLQKKFTSEGEFLKSLEMWADIKPVDTFTLARLEQLTQRSNQFNLRTRRYTAEDISVITNDPAKYTLTVSLKDRFGDYGLISSVILERKSENELFIDTWIMSCRVLKRTVENMLLNEVVDLAKKYGYTTLRGEYIPTAKNGLVKDFYKELGFHALDKNEWVMNLDQYQEKPTFINKTKKYAT